MKSLPVPFVYGEILTNSVRSWRNSHTSHLFQMKSLWILLIPEEIQFPWNSEQFRSFLIKVWLILLILREFWSYSHSVCVCQFCLPKAEKELYEKEERPETQQEILKRVASSLPLYTRTGAGGERISVTVLNDPIKMRLTDKSIIDYSLCIAIRYCDRCQVIKPDRCHHCSACDMWVKATTLQTTPGLRTLKKKKVDIIIFWILYNTLD